MIKNLMFCVGMLGLFPNIGWAIDSKKPTLPSSSPPAVGPTSTISHDGGHEMGEALTRQVIEKYKRKGYR